MNGVRYHGHDLGFAIFMGTSTGWSCVEFCRFIVVMSSAWAFGVANFNNRH